MKKGDEEIAFNEVYSLSLWTELLHVVEFPRTSSQFDSQSDWRNHYRAFQFEHVLKPRERGSLVLEQNKSKGDLKLISTATAELSRSAYISLTSADCIERELIMPVNWTTERGHVPKMPWTGTRIEGGIKEGGMTLKNDGGVSTWDLRDQDWSSFDTLIASVQNLENRADVRFCLIDEWCQLKPNQRVRCAGEYRIRFDGFSVALTQFVLSGEATLPVVFWTDRRGRVLYFASGMEVYVLDSQKSLP